MRSLKSAFAGNEQKPQATESSAPEERANRTAIRLAANRWSRRQRQALGILLLTLFLSLIASIVWADRTGRIDVWSIKFGLWIENRLAQQGLAAPNVQVSGLKYTTPEDIRSALGAHDLEPLTRIQPHQAAEQLETLPWVLEASVQRLWPQTIHIQIQEKQAIALLHRGNNTYLIDGAGEIIAEAYEGISYGFPQISGEGAENAAPHLIEIIASFPTIKDRLVGAIRISNRRWDLYFSPGVKVNLPAGQTFEGLNQLQGLITEYDILEREIVALDLRGKRPIILR